MILRKKVSLTTSLFAWLITPSERLATKALVGISELVEAWLLENERLWNPPKNGALEFGIMIFKVPADSAFFLGCVCFFDPTIRPTTSWGWHWHWVANKILCQISAVSQTGTCVWSYKVRSLKSKNFLQFEKIWWSTTLDTCTIGMCVSVYLADIPGTMHMTPQKLPLTKGTSSSKPPNSWGLIPNTIGIHLSNELHSTKSLAFVGIHVFVAYEPIPTTG